MKTPVPTGGGPLVAALCRVPLLCEALASAFEGIAEIRAFPAELDDTDGLLRSLRPDAVVVDTEMQASEAEPFARETQTPLVHVLLREQHLRVLRNDSWELLTDGDTSPEAIRNLIVGGMYRRQPA